MEIIKNKESYLIEISLSVFCLKSLESLENLHILKGAIKDDKLLPYVENIEQNIKSIYSTFDEVLKQLSKKETD